MSEMLEKELNQFLTTTTTDILAERRSQFDAYMNREYKGKPWRRMTNEEVAALDDESLRQRLAEINALHGPKPEKEFITVDGEQVELLPDTREIRSDEPFVLGFGGDASNPDGTKCETEEDWARLDQSIASERSRVFRIISSPPRSDRYVETFKRKFPNRTEDEIRKGFILRQNGIDAPDFTAWQERQEDSHVRSGRNRLTQEQVAAREEENGPENLTPVRYANLEDTIRIQNAILHNSPGVNLENARQMMLRGQGNSEETNADEMLKREKKAKRDAYIEKQKFEVMETDEFSPEEDLLEAEPYWNSSPTRVYVDRPVDDLLKTQNESLKITEIVRHIPPQEESNG